MKNYPPNANQGPRSHSHSHQWFGVPGERPWPPAAYHQNKPAALACWYLQVDPATECPMAPSAHAQQIQDHGQHCQPAAKKTPRPQYMGLTCTHIRCQCASGQVLLVPIGRHHRTRGRSTRELTHKSQPRSDNQPRLKLHSGSLWARSEVLLELNSTPLKGFLCSLGCMWLPDITPEAGIYRP